MIDETRDLMTCSVHFVYEFSAQHGSHGSCTTVCTHHNSKDSLPKTGSPGWRFWGGGLRVGAGSNLYREICAESYRSGRAKVRAKVVLSSRDRNWQLIKCGSACGMTGVAMVKNCGMPRLRLGAC
jgi:hypothetical protein